MTQKVRSLFFSDVHLGFRYSRTRQFLEMLRQYEPEQLYIVGDFLDGWRLARNWHWPLHHDQIADRILALAAAGVPVRYTPGNHDEFLRRPHPSLQGIVVADEFFHTGADGRRWLVTHGDLFDAVEKKLRRTSRVGSRIYDSVIWTNLKTNRVLRTAGLGEFNYGYALKGWSKRLVGAIGALREVLVRHATELGCSGVICGHLHLPQISTSDGFAWCNTGDWVEHQSMIIEHGDGSMELLDRGRSRGRIPAQGASHKLRPAERRRDGADIRTLTGHAEDTVTTVAGQADRRESTPARKPPHPALSPATGERRPERRTKPR
jgi:UDP-2,3-diacylglucosamine pyrophosphatase LpxH